ncbi:nitrogen fixation protein NifW [Novosphingobium nitrogenifigens DSM 19370]|uniref:Nitrogenase-stabilizing/protective protein NifW n=1 Tax=Novosphingobium nitrogenifigens DSM 19370 TaxID=983920 RepID=F1Z3C7_9SPHN|nr:nitrogenase stabilizing/protective protein NifW [Novosphingobium nitrogenifigens]EGD60886.1 nitrogen fixation protein NifW [Novosphingobium nitrogenifigens DSM 19370]
MSLLDRLQSLSSAEEFFEVLDVPYDEAVVRVARLHILRRMGQYLRGSAADGAFDGADEAGVEALCREHLAQAYADFVASSPIAERIFKVHQDALRPKPEPNRPFVPLSALTGE